MPKTSSNKRQRSFLSATAVSGDEASLQKSGPVAGVPEAEIFVPDAKRRAAVAAAAPLIFDIDDNQDGDQLYTSMNVLFGHTSFREGQEAVIRRLLDGESIAAILPTGAGKSLCYQLPGLMLSQQGKGLTIVVSPLIALMKDQCDALAAKGLPCCRLDSSLDAHEASAAYAALKNKELGMVYVSPERFNNERFMRAVKENKVCLFVVDEAHCVSEWGHNFRPDYLRLSSFARAVGAEATLALTATATARVADDICDRLGIQRTSIVRTPLHRHNLTLRALRAPDAFEDRVRTLIGQLQDTAARPPGMTIVYAMLQKTAAETAERLSAAGIPARAYHAGLSSDVRTEVQEWFMHGDASGSSSSGSGKGAVWPAHARVVVGTIAFGMGIDCDNVRYVYHFSVPRSIESYTQEVGRAGRDGQPSLCEALVSPADLPLLRSMIYGNTPSLPAVHSLLGAVFEEDSTEADISLYDMSQELDVKDLVLHTLLAHLQMDGRLREVTSYFAYQQVGLSALAQSRNTSLDAMQRALLTIVKDALAVKRKNAKWVDLDVKHTAAQIGATKLQISSILQSLADSNVITLGAARKIRSRFEILRRPESAAATAALAEQLHAQAQLLEDRELQRLESAWQLLCSSGGRGISAGLSAHFDDPAAAVAAASAADAAVQWGSAAAADAELAQVLQLPALPAAQIDAQWAAAIEQLPAGRLPLPHDAALVAKFVAGIKSPIITRLRLQNESGFGCCAECPYPELLQRAEQWVSDGAPT